MSKINLLDLAAASVACTVTASQAITRLAAVDTNTRFKSDGSTVTDADFCAQGIIVAALQNISTEINILGEESSDEMAQHIVPLVDEGAVDDIRRRTREEIRLLHRYHTEKEGSEKRIAELPSHLPLSAGANHLDSSQLPPLPSDNDTVNDPDHCYVEASRLTVIVDPLDGSKSYAAGEYEVVSILIAIVLDQEPIFGVIGKPFGYTGLTNIRDSGCATVYGGSLIQAVYIAGGRQLLPLPQEASPTPPRAVISSSRSGGIVQDFCLELGQEGLLHPEPLHVAGAGEKSLRLILRLEGEGLWFYPKAGTSLWDVAAPDAILRVLDGILTDKDGTPLQYQHKTRLDAENRNGVVACNSKSLHAACLQRFQEGGWNERLPVGSNRRGRTMTENSVV